MAPHCPICKSPSTLSLQLSREKIVSALEAFTGYKFAASIVKTDYSMYSCGKCTLEFADPMRAGDEEFYNALTKVPGYYPEDRLEYLVVCEQVSNSFGENASVLDIGCGSGDFLAHLKNRHFTDLTGIDLTLSSVEKAKAKGLNVYCERMEDSNRGPFDVVTSFHCLEHVEDPVLFMRNALAQTKGNGTVYISTPYSPQAIEYGWYHPLNYPPHHTLRFNLTSYRTLAEVVNADVEFVNFHRASMKSQFRAAFLFARFGHNKAMSTFSVLMQMLLHPALAMKLWRKMKQREVVNGHIVGPDILVKFRKRQQP